VTAQVIPENLKNFSAFYMQRPAVQAESELDSYFQEKNKSMEVVTTYRRMQYKRGSHLL
jgi:hypothetical protein